MDIVLNCPQCGAEVDLAEDAHVFRCRYCSSILKPTGRNEIQSFFFPPRNTPEQAAGSLDQALRGKMPSFRIKSNLLVYAPYWRVQGMLFQWAFGRLYETTLYGGTSYDHFKRLRSASYHRTFPAFSAERWGLHSLGLRAQVVKMYPYSRSSMGEAAFVLRQDVPLDHAVRVALQSPYPANTEGGERVEILKTQLIGERYTLVYFPFHCFKVRQGKEERTLILDGLADKIIRGDLDLDSLASDAEAQAIPYRPLDFIPFKCPDCGWDLPYRPKARVHLCRTCGKAWEEMGGAFRETAFKFVSPGEVEDMGEAWTYLPFWVLTASIQTPGKTYGNLKEFYELFPLPRVQDSDVLSRQPIRFFIPAFRVKNPVAVDKFAAQLTRTQPSFRGLDPERTDFRKIRTADLSLPLKEALEMAHLLLFSMTPKRARRTLEKIKDASVALGGGDLLWLPFFERGIFLREATTDFAIQKNCLEI